MISPHAAWTAYLTLAVLYGAIWAMHVYDHITERAALRCYLALSLVGIVYIIAAGYWWPLILAVPAALIFTWALVNAPEDV